MSTIALPMQRTAAAPGIPAPLIAGKLLAAALLSCTLVVPAAGGFQGEALWLRGLVYAAGLGAIPAAAALRRAPAAYPVAADAYLLLPFLVDAAGNTLGLYASVDNFDNLAHLVGSVAFAGFAGSLLRSRCADRWSAAACACGVAAMLGIGIELAEWTAFAHPVAAGYGAYRDTIGDLAMDMAGALAGAVATALGRR